MDWVYNPQGLNDPYNLNYKIRIWVMLTMALMTRVTYTGLLLVKQSCAGSFKCFRLSSKILRQMSRMPGSNCTSTSHYIIVFMFKAFCQSSLEIIKVSK